VGNEILDSERMKQRQILERLRSILVYCQGESELQRVAIIPTRSSRMETRRGGSCPSVGTPL
jgi:hypothetical protein